MYGVLWGWKWSAGPTAGLDQKYFIDVLMFPLFGENQLKNSVFQPYPTRTPYISFALLILLNLQYVMW